MSQSLAEYDVAPEAVEPVAALVADEPLHYLPKSWPVRAWRALCFGLEWLFGLASLIGCLAVVAAIPLVNFLALGYLLEASGRVARSGRWRDGFIDIGKFARIGSLAIGTWLVLLIPRLVRSFATDAWLIDPDGPAARGWQIALVTVTGLAVAHVLLAWYSGGRLRHFFWPLLAVPQLTLRALVSRVVAPVARPLVNRVSPALADDLFIQRPLVSWFPPAILAAGIRRGRMVAEARDAVWEFVTSLKLPYYFWLGVRGFAGGLAWLLLPSLMLMAGASGGGPATVFVGVLGAVALFVVLLYLPLLQARFACENRWLAIFELGEVRQEIRRAPLACWLGLAATLLLALPLYVLKIEPVIPPEFQWMVTLFFILLLYPARLVTGWAISRARRRAEPLSFAVCWFARAAAVPVIALYVFIVFFTQFTSFTGPASLLEHHAFLLPAPFVIR